MHLLLLLATVMLDAHAASGAQEDSLGQRDLEGVRAFVPPGLFLSDRRPDDGGGDPLFDLPSWLSDMIEGEIIPDLPDFEIRISTRRLRLGYTFRF